jgi:hypothetical protein
VAHLINNQIDTQWAIDSLRGVDKERINHFIYIYKPIKKYKFNYLINALIFLISMHVKSSFFLKV